MTKYAIKTDDILLRLLNSYHKVDASEALSFFGERVKEMLECKPNITEKSRRTAIFQDNGRTNSIPDRHGSSKHFLLENDVYVLRGFYPGTHLPFKLTLVKFARLEEARAKVILGLKDHNTTLRTDEITAYEEAMSEAILLDNEVDNEAKIKYKYRAFKCMRPQGMELYHEKK